MAVRLDFVQYMYMYITIIDASRTDKLLIYILGDKRPFPVPHLWTACTQNMHDFIMQTRNANKYEKSFIQNSGISEAKRIETSW